MKLFVVVAMSGGPWLEFCLINSGCGTAIVVSGYVAVKSGSSGTWPTSESNGGIQSRKGPADFPNIDNSSSRNYDELVSRKIQNLYATRRLTDQSCII